MSNKKKLIIYVFIFFHLTVAAMLTIPGGSDVLKTTFPLGNLYRRFFGLKQTWNMFAIYTPYTNLSTQVMLSFSDGSIEEWSFQKTNPRPPLEQFIVQQRMRKYEINLATMKWKKICSDLTRYVARQVKKPGLVYVTVYRHRTTIQDPATGFTLHGQKNQNNMSEPLCLHVVSDRMPR